MNHSRFAFIALALSLAAPVLAADHTGQMGLNYTVGPSFIIGGDHATDTSSVQPGIGAGLQLGIRPNLDVKFNYDYIDADLRSQALTFGGQWGLAPASHLKPFVGAGIGFGKPYTGEGWDHFSLKLEGGLEKELTPEFSLAAVFGYQYIDGTDELGSVHTLQPGLRLTYFFGSYSRL